MGTVRPAVVAGLFVVGMALQGRGSRAQQPEIPGATMPPPPEGDQLRWGPRTIASGCAGLDRAHSCPTVAQRGVYEMEVFLYWPGSGIQYSRADLSPIVID
jgi:hypothetical protein